jgi:dTDP-4-amino-4,6-dideoxygalactose transaminase
MINVFQPSLGCNEWSAVKDVFQSNWIGRGAKVREFEAAWARHIGVDPAQVVATNSCTEALFQAVRLLGITTCDRVIIPTIHFVGAAQAVMSAGAFPVFCDVNSRTLNATAETIEAKITPQTRAVILNHYGGVACNMVDIMTMLEKHPDIKLIEDAACAPTTRYKDKAIGTFGDIGVWSFDAMKIISTGDGGMMYFKDKALADKARVTMYLGMDGESGISKTGDKWWEFEVKITGARRSIMNDITAAIGLEQLLRWGEFIINRMHVFDLYQALLQDDNNYKVPSSFMVEPSYFYWIQTNRRDDLAAYLKQQGIYTTSRYYPLHWAYNTGDSLPQAEEAARTTLLLPYHQSLTDDDVNYICDKIKEFYERN